MWSCSDIPSTHAGVTPAHHWGFGIRGTFESLDSSTTKPTAFLLLGSPDQETKRGTAELGRASPTTLTTDLAGYIIKRQMAAHLIAVFLLFQLFNHLLEGVANIGNIKILRIFF